MHFLLAKYLSTFFVPQEEPQLVVDGRVGGEVDDHVLALGKQLLHLHLLHEPDQHLLLADEDVDPGAVLSGLQDGMGPHLKEEFSGCEKIPAGNQIDL